MHLADLATPALIADLVAFDHNVATMSAALPGPRLRPHVKAFKSTALARHLVAAGHAAFCCATIREMEGMAAAGLGHDLLLANEVLDCTRLGQLAQSGTARITVAVDSERTVAAAAQGGVMEVLIDVNIGLARCGCLPQDAGRTADIARQHGLAVRGVMGYEGHLVGLAERSDREAGLEQSLQLLRTAHAAVGGDVISGGGTGTYDLNNLCTEIQAGSYVLLDTHYARLGLPFRQGLGVLGTVVSLGASKGRPYGVIDVGLKCLGMDHGNPEILDIGLAAGSFGTANVWFCSDEHSTFSVADPSAVAVGSKVLVRPAHIDPTIALHETIVVVNADAEIVDHWPVDLRGW